MLIAPSGFVAGIADFPFSIKPIEIALFILMGFGATIAQSFIGEVSPDQARHRFYQCEHPLCFAFTGSLIFFVAGIFGFFSAMYSGSGSYITPALMFGAGGSGLLALPLGLHILERRLEK